MFKSRPSKHSSPKSLGIIDVLFLVLLSGLALASLRAYLWRVPIERSEVLDVVLPGGKTAEPPSWLTSDLRQGFVFFLVPYTIGLPLLRFRRAQGPFREIVCRLGVSGITSVCIVIGVHTLNYGLSFASRVIATKLWFNPLVMEYVAGLSGETALAIIAVWSILYLSGRLRWPDDTKDTIMAVLCVLWILQLFSEAILNLSSKAIVGMRGVSWLP